MPLMKPEVQKVLRAAGLAKETSAPEGTLIEKFETAGLSTTEAVEELVGIAKNNGNDALRLRAIELALKLQGVLKETAAPPAAFSIIIQSDAFGTITPVENVNPILLPRQLLNEQVPTEKVN